MERIQKKPKGIPLGIRLGILRVLDRTGWMHVVVRAMLGTDWLMLGKGSLGVHIYFGYMEKDEPMKVKYSLDITPRINRVGVCTCYRLVLENPFFEVVAHASVDNYIGDWIMNVYSDLYKRRSYEAD